jgi:hypothetical protein
LDLLSKAHKPQIGAWCSTCSCIQIRP